MDRLYNAQANDLTGGANINTTFADMVGNITIDESSKLTVNTAFSNTGSITINVADEWLGFATVIDAVAGTADFGTIVLNENDAANGSKLRSLLKKRAPVSLSYFAWTKKVNESRLPWQEPILKTER